MMFANTGTQKAQHNQDWQDNNSYSHDEDEFFLSKTSDVIFLLIRICLIIAVIAGVAYILSALA